MAHKSWNEQRGNSRTPDPDRHSMQQRKRHAPERGAGKRLPMRRGRSNPAGRGKQHKAGSP